MGEPAEATTATRSGVIWKRAGALFVVCMIAVAVLAIGLIMGVIPVQMVLSKNPFQLTVEGAEAENFAAYVGNHDRVDGGQLGGASLELEGGTIDNLCLTTNLKLPFIDTLGIKITSGGSRSIPLQTVKGFTNDITIEKVTVTDADLGVAASDLEHIDGPGGAWGIQLTNARVENLVVEGRHIDVASIQLRGLGLGLGLGEEIHCTDDAEE